MAFIDLNSDVGESFGNWKMGDDAAIFTSVSSANVACGFHAGDPSTIAQTCRETNGRTASTCAPMSPSEPTSAIAT